ncbi:MAG TPA: cytochrome c [Steroidobacteraceae bacterium]|jgi:mono/diheme cytochrome c family protein
MFTIIALLSSALAPIARSADPAPQQSTKPASKPKNSAAQAAPAAGGALYTVKDGDKVDPNTLNGWKTWRALACERCHGAEQEGLVGPALVESLKKLTKEEFHTTVINGRPDKGMPPFGGSAMVMQNWEGLYAYLKGRSDGKIKPGHLYPIGSPGQ